MSCTHERFHIHFEVLEYVDESKRHVAEIQLCCNDCGMPFQFVGLPIGCNLDGATVADREGTTARLAIAPAVEAPRQNATFVASDSKRLN